ncbi:MAG: deoxyribose-phosphate aldolase [Bacteroides sp.]|nr:deoxyribose-phosphate aldolase [Bacteroides sp.]MDD4719386.1 deoxyribose-phosphate aldolase [Bacteroides sp.]NLI64845.1 deoxyribose-phosphate aldolase [Bacteroidales bacterium]
MNNKVEHTNDDKYLLALSKYNTDIKDEEVKKEVAKLIKEKTAENNTKDVKAFLFNCIDLTSLTPTDNDESILSMVEKVNQFSDTYPELKNVAAMCVYPNFTSIVKNSLEVEDVNIACVSAGFPSSQTFIEVKIAETAMAIMEGADEVDVVISVGKFLNGDYETLCDELEEIKDLAENKGRHVKVILETGALQSAENIKKASILAMYSGADFIKTSTGKEKISATPEAAYVMCQAIKEYYEETGNKVGFKPAGGLSTPEDAIIYYTIVKEILGTEWLTNKLFRLGTSRLANLLLSDIKEKEINFF